MDRYRTHKRPAPPTRLREDEIRFVYTGSALRAHLARRAGTVNGLLSSGFQLPASVINRMTWEQTRRERPPTDLPDQPGEVAANQQIGIGPSRDLSRPGFLYDTNGPGGLAIVGAEEEHIRDLQEIAAEWRHYHPNGYVRTKPRVDPVARITEYNEYVERRARGLTTYGPTTTGLL